MPFLKTRVIMENIEPIEVADSGHTLGQLVDLELAELMANLSPNSVPLSIEVGFEDSADFHQFMRAYPMPDLAGHTKRRKSRNSDTIQSGDY